MSYITTYIEYLPTEKNQIEVSFLSCHSFLALFSFTKNTRYVLQDPKRWQNHLEHTTDIFEQLEHFKVTPVSDLDLK